MSRTASAMAETIYPPHIEGRHPMLYFNIQRTEKYSIAMCYPYLQIPLYIFGNPSVFGICLCLYADKSAHSKNIIHSVCLPFF